MPKLTHDLIERAVPPAPPGPAAPAPDELRLRAEMLVFLHGRDPALGLWVFADDALMRDHGEAAPDIAAPARLPGLARRYTVRDVQDRGTPAAPALALALEEVPALACAGLLLHLPGPKVEDRLWPVWRRKMAAGGHDPRWRDALLTRAHDGSGAPVRALCFLARHNHPLYEGEQPLGTVADRLARARGPGGAAAGALLDAAETLRRHGLRDALLESLEAEVARHLSPPAAPAAPPLPIEAGRARAAREAAGRA
ncbi:hypothetical protein EAH89_20050 [Roseomonas nepalensis]|uniref:glutathione-specific gamma-glutamylcyclotransferase n=1 Tax=Muricoccus nepalensis TaxID=1854500 RepID=A0A502FQW4_9PROT|nr:gamma-glutamylcyclotransferase [Roseomonas nepalensis]TPG51536.1 hypothetical protein EAH89_20050 [Roseomonas nepalensis]